MTHSCARTQSGRLRREPYTGPVTQPPAPSQDEIARLAYSYWESRGRVHGFHEQDWHQAERELIRRRSAFAWS